MATASKNAAKEEKYYYVTFAAKASEQGTEQVQLGVNGKIVVIQREQEVILPERYLEVADHAIVEKWKQLPGEDRKKTGSVQTYPYRRGKQATKADYLKALKEGTAAARKAAEAN